MIKPYLFLASIHAIFSRLNADIIFTSPLRTKALFSSVDLVIETLQDYITSEENRLNALESSLRDWINERESYVEDPESHFTNHIAQFNFLYKLNQRQLYWNNVMKNNSSSDFISRIKTSNTTWPSDLDITGVMDSIINLQNIYQMTAESFANGVLHGVSTNTSLDYEECFMMAERCFETIHYKLALQWASIALKKYHIEGIDNQRQLSDILFYIAYTSYIAGDFNLAFEMITSYMEKNPDQKGEQLRKTIIFSLPENHEHRNFQKEEYMKKMKHLCNKITSITELFRFAHLRCRYNSDNYFLKIAPLKEEVLSLKPKLSLFREVLYDSEIRFLKEYSTDRLQELETNEEFEQYYDQVEMADFEHHFDGQIDQIYERIGDMATLQFSPKNPIQLHKYRVGGSFVDRRVLKNPTKDRISRRRSTILFQLNDVIRGGSTIFPELEIAVKAEKGTALFWLNEITPDFNKPITYSSCPVAVGQKWTLIKHIFQEEEILI